MNANGYAPHATDYSLCYFYFVGGTQWPNVEENSYVFCSPIEVRPLSLLIIYVKLLIYASFSAWETTDAFKVIDQ